MAGLWKGGPSRPWPVPAPGESGDAMMPAPGAGETIDARPDDLWRGGPVRMPRPEVQPLPLDHLTPGYTIPPRQPGATFAPAEPLPFGPNDFQPGHGPVQRGGDVDMQRRVQMLIQAILGRRGRMR